MGSHLGATWEPLWEYPFLLPLGKQKNFSVFGEYLRNSNEKDVFLLLAYGAEKGPCLPGSGRTQAPRKVSLPEAATPQVCSSTSIITCTAGRPAHWAPIPDSPHMEDWCCRDYHQLQLPLRTVVPASGFVYSGSWTGGDILVRGEFGLGVCLLVVCFFFNDNEVTL